MSKKLERGWFLDAIGFLGGSFVVIGGIVLNNSAVTLFGLLMVLAVIFMLLVEIRYK